MIFDNKNHFLLQHPIKISSIADISSDPLSIQLVGTCRGCRVLDSGGFNLFDDGFGSGGRYLTEKMLLDGLDLSSMPRQAQDLGQAECVCPTGKEPSLEGGPSSRAFESIFLENIAPLVEGDGSTPSIVDTPANIVEVSPAPFFKCC